MDDARSRKALLHEAVARAMDYLDGLSTRRVGASPEAVARLDQLGGSLPEEPGDPLATLRQLDEIASPATVTSAGGRYFGFVMGGTLPVALAAQWLAGAWDQNAGLQATSPAAAALDEVAIRWIVELLSLPPDTGGGLVTGATVANLTALAAARHALLQRAGWDVEAAGLQGAPPLHVVVGEEVHVSVLKALGILGLGRERVQRVAVDAQGRMRVDALPELTPATLLCIQAGNVDTGAFDPAKELCAAAHEAGAWVHVDGAFGLWLAAVPSCAALTAGLQEADSWALDAHKWLNVPYDCGVALCRDAPALRAAMSVHAAYLDLTEGGDPSQATPELSRRARGVEVWAALRTLGRQGFVELLEGCCRHARRFAEGLAAAGHQVLNEVVSNQVLVTFGDAATTRRVITALQEDGTCWCGVTVWQGKTAMRISVSSWATTDEDVERSLDAMLRIAAEAPGR